MASEPFDTVEAAIESKIEAAGITTIRYEGPTVPKHPIATVIPEDVIPEYLGPDQGFTMGQISYVVRLYYRMSKDPKLAWDDAKAGLAAVYGAIGADRSLGGAVRACDITRSRFEPVETVMEGAPEIMVEIGLEVRPRPS